MTKGDDVTPGLHIAYDLARGDFDTMAAMEARFYAVADHLPWPAK